MRERKKEKRNVEENRRKQLKKTFPVIFVTNVT